MLDGAEFRAGSGHVPQVGAAAAAAHRHPAAVRAERDPVVVPAAVRQRRGELAGRAPQVDVAVRVSHRVQAAGRVERDAVDAVAVRIAEGVQLLAGGGVPQVAVPVAVPSGQHALGAEHVAEDVLAVRVVQGQLRQGRHGGLHDRARARRRMPAARCRRLDRRLPLGRASVREQQAGRHADGHHGRARADQQATARDAAASLAARLRRLGRRPHRGLGLGPVRPGRRLVPPGHVVVGALPLGVPAWPGRRVIAGPRGLGRLVQPALQPGPARSRRTCRPRSRPAAAVRCTAQPGQARGRGRRPRSGLAARPARARPAARLAGLGRPSTARPGSGPGRPPAAHTCARRTARPGRAAGAEPAPGPGPAARVDAGRPHRLSQLGRRRLAEAVRLSQPLHDGGQAGPVGRVLGQALADQLAEAALLRHPGQVRLLTGDPVHDRHDGVIAERDPAGCGEGQRAAEREDVAGRARDLAA